MKNNKIIILLIIIIIGLVSFIVYKNFKSDKSVELQEVENTTSQVESIVVADSFQSITLNPNDPYAKFDIKYPVFNNVSKDFNINIENFFKERIEEHKIISKENWQARYDTQVKGDNIPKVPPLDEKFAFYSDFKVVQSNSNYISCVITYGGFTGGAHGYENDISFNYDVKNQKDMNLKDLFPNDQKYLDYISSKSRESLKKTFATVSEDDRKYATEEELKVIVDDIVSSIENGTEPKEENFSVFTFTKDKIKIYFSQYQVGPYAIGKPTVEINRK